MYLTVTVLYVTKHSYTRTAPTHAMFYIEAYLLAEPCMTCTPNLSHMRCIFYTHKPENKLTFLQGEADSNNN